MTSTLLFDEALTRSLDGHVVARPANELLDRYRSFVEQQRLSWTDHHKLLRLLGQGGQGMVYLSQRRGADGFTLPVALKVFSPERYHDSRGYDEAMERMAQVGARVAQIQQDNLLNVYNFIDRNRIRLMEMEWVDGHDLSQLLTRETHERVRDRVSARRWNYLNEVVVTAGPEQPRLKPGIAIAVLRDCLAALAALHREGVVHGDIKTSNIMLKRTGTAKVIDFGAAFPVDEIPHRRMCTPSYAAPEVLDGGDATPQSDLASLGYVLVEMLSGRPLFAQFNSLPELLEAKRLLTSRLPTLLPPDVVCNELLLGLCQGLIASDPARRFPSAEAADFVKNGAAAFHRQLVKGDLASEYDNEIRLWLQELE